MGGEAAAAVPLVVGVGLDVTPAPVGCGKVGGAVATSDDDAAGGVSSGVAETAGCGGGRATAATEEATGGVGGGSAAMADDFVDAPGPRDSSATAATTMTPAAIPPIATSLFREAAFVLTVATPDADDATSGVPRPSAGIVASHCGPPEPLAPRS